MNLQHCDLKWSAHNDILVMERLAPEQFTKSRHHGRDSIKLVTEWTPADTKI